MEVLSVSVPVCLLEAFMLGPLKEITRRFRNMEYQLVDETDNQRRTAFYYGVSSLS